MPLKVILMKLLILPNPQTMTSCRLKLLPTCTSVQSTSTENTF